MRTCRSDIGKRSVAKFALPTRRSTGSSSAIHSFISTRTYLRAYDKETSKSGGVYYTPPPIVNFIVRAVDDILKVELRHCGWSCRP